ncbi:hypothetical protein Tco_1252772 [Tanacetum coccineum]
MSSSNHPIIVPSDSDIKDAFSSTNDLDYFPATPRNTSPDSSNDLTKYLLATLVFLPLHDDPYMEVMQAYDATGEAVFILGIKIYRDRSKRLIKLGQTAYIDMILKRYKMDNSKHGHILMQETLDLNKTQGAVDWKSSKQSTTTMSAIEAEYIATSKAAMEIMSSSNHPIIVPSDSDIEDAFSSTNDPDYFPATPRNTSPDSSNDLTKYLLATLVFSPLHDDPYMEVMQAYDATDNELPIPPL